MDRRENLQRIVVGMMDGFGMDYFKMTDMPNLKQMANEGFFKEVKGLFPSITNVNNVSICCGAWPDEHGITGNSYFNETTGKAEYMNAADLIRVDTLFQRAAGLGIKSALLTSKRKTVELFNRGTEIAIAAEEPPSKYVYRHGKPADIYSREINYWLWETAVDILKTRPDIGCVYVHITDYPMHMWSPEQIESKEHLQNLDKLIGKAGDAALDAAFFFTADHGMNFKRQCWDLVKICKEKGTSIRFALSPERDYYVKHHRNFTGCAYVWLKTPDDAKKVIDIIRDLKGVEEVISTKDATRRFHLIPNRIGDLTVIGDKDTMFGDLETTYEKLPPTYRAHGSLHEMDLPLIIFNLNDDLPSTQEFQTNKDLTRFLYR